MIALQSFSNAGCAAFMLQHYVEALGHSRGGSWSEADRSMQKSRIRFLWGGAFHKLVWVQVPVFPLFGVNYCTPAQHFAACNFSPLNVSDMRQPCLQTSSIIISRGAGSDCIMLKITCLGWDFHGLSVHGLFCILGCRQPGCRRTRQTCQAEHVPGLQTTLSQVSFPRGQPWPLEGSKADA